MGHDYDFIVVGGGNAGLVAALTALEKGKRVLLLEKAPQEDRGGNSKYTRDFRVAHRNGQFGLDGEYSYDEFMEDLIKVTKGQTDKRLARMVVENSDQAVKWANEHGVKWQRSLPSTLHLGRTNLFILGGGKALLNTYYEKLKNKHGTVMYGSEVNAVEVEGNEFRSVIVNQGNEKLKFRASELVLSSGGFESNLELLKKFWGVRADNMIIRGTHNNTGLPMISMIENGAETIGKGDDGHVVAVDARSPKFNGGIVTRVDSIPFSITVNREGERFYDEGEDLWPKRYAIWGKLIAGQPGQVAYSIFDKKVWGKFIPPFKPPITDPTLEGIINRLVEFGLRNPERALETVKSFNSACRENTRADHARLDGTTASGIIPPKSNWALPIDEPPFYAFVLKPGLTFTYMSLRVDERARVVKRDGTPFSNIYAAGEIMAGNILTNGYLGGLGLVIGTIFGIIAGGGQI